MIDGNVVRASTDIQGFGYVSKSSDTLSIGSFSLGAGARSSAFTLTVATPNTDSASLVQVKFSGVGNTDVNNNWLASSKVFFRNSAPSYDVMLFTQRNGGNQVTTVQFYNSTGAGVTIPAITVAVKVYYYTAPW